MRASHHRVGDALQLGEIEAAVAQLDLHGEAGGVADALDRRRRQHQDARLLDRPDACRSGRTNSDSRSWSFARAPSPSGSCRRRRRWRAGAVVERGDAGDGDDLSTPGVLLAISLTWSSTFWVRSSEAPSGSCTVAMQIALVLDRQEAGRHPRQAVAADRDRSPARRRPTAPLCAPCGRSGAA